MRLIIFEQENDKNIVIRCATSDKVTNIHTKYILTQYNGNHYRLITHNINNINNIDVGIFNNNTLPKEVKNMFIRICQNKDKYFQPDN
jgi:hypothetical protein